MKLDRLFDLPRARGQLSRPARWGWPADGRRPAEWERISFCCAPRKSAACRLPKNCKNWRQRFSLSACDVKAAPAFRSCDTAVKQFGRIDILINCGPLWVRGRTMTLEQWNKVNRNNLTGTFFFAGRLARSDRAAPREDYQYGFRCGLRGSSPKFSAIGYTPAKAASLFLRRTWPAKWGNAQHFRWNAIAPGMVPTDMSEKVIEQDKIAVGRHTSGPLWRAARSEGGAIFLASVRQIS